MKILVAYDGSDGSDRAIDSLRRAGLERQGVEALVLSVAEVWLPDPLRPDEIDDTFPLQIPAAVKLAHAQARARLAEVEKQAESGRDRVQRVFPEWTVHHETVMGAPAFEILNRAEAWHPDLMVVGSYGRTALGRFVLGSVSQKVLTEAPTSVRIGRESTGVGDSAERIILGVDGSPGSHLAVQAVAERSWRPGSEVRVVVAQDPVQAFPLVTLLPPVKEYVDEATELSRIHAEEIAATAVKELRAKLDEDVTVSSLIESGDPKQVLVRCAEEFGADCIFTGVSGFSNRLERFILGSVSAAVASRASCSVEVVRPR